MKQKDPMPEITPRTTIKKRNALPERAAAMPKRQESPVGQEALDKRVVIALHAASDKKALEPIVLDLRPLASFTDYFLITSGTNARQVQAIADEVVERLKKDGARAARVEGYSTGEWVLLDYGDFVFHIFEDKARRFYDLERLWRDAVRVELPPDLRSEASRSSDGSLRRES